MSLSGLCCEIFLWKDGSSVEIGQQRRSRAKKEPDLRGRAGTRRQAVGLTKINGGEIEESLLSSAH